MVEIGGEMTLPGTGDVIRAGYVPPATLGLLPLMITLADRMAPWAAWWFVPSLWSQSLGDGYATSAGAIRLDDDGVEWSSVGGIAYSGVATAAVVLRSPHLTVPTVSHEAFHLLSPHLPSCWHHALDAAVSSGPDYPGVYLGSAEERKARLFEHWCMTFLEGMPPRTSTGAVDDILHPLWSGALGAEVARRLADPHPAPSPLPWWRRLLGMDSLT